MLKEVLEDWKYFAESVYSLKSRILSAMEYLIKFILSVNLQNGQPLISLNILHRLNDPGFFLYITFFKL